MIPLLDRSEVSEAFRAAFGRSPHLWDIPPAKEQDYLRWLVARIRADQEPADAECYAFLGVTPPGNDRIM